MVRFFGSIQGFKIDGKGYTDYVRQQIELNVRQAAREFIRAAIPRVPVLSGMARGSFLHLGRALRVAIPINPSQRNGIYYGPNGERLPKTPESGARLSTSPENAFKNRGNNIQFEFNTRVFHYTLEDIFGVRSPTAPWRSFQAGQEAFILEMQHLTKRLQSIRSFVTMTTVTFGKGSGITRSEEPLDIRRSQRVDVII